MLPSLESHLFSLTLPSDKNKPQGGGEATAEMQKGNLNSSELIKKLQEENKGLHKMVDELKANMTALINKDGRFLSTPLSSLSNITINNQPNINFFV